MHCVNCGNKLDEGVNFCGKCGSSADQTETGSANKNPRKLKSILVSLVSILAFIIAFGGVRYLAQEGIGSISNNNLPSKQELITQAVQEVRDNTIFPSEIDKVTILTAVMGTSNAIRYQYTLHDIDENQLSNTFFKNNIAPSACKNVSTRYILDQDINLEYSYAVQNSSTTFFVSVSQADCL